MPINLRLTCNFNIAAISVLRYHILCLLLISLSFKVKTQTLAGFTNFGVGTFYDMMPEGGHSNQLYSSKFNFGLGMELKDVCLDTLIRFQFSLSYQNYGGKFEFRNGGGGGSNSIKGSIELGVLNFDIYPICLRFFEQIRWNIGFSGNLLLHKNLNGQKEVWDYGSQSDPGSHTTTDLNDIDEFKHIFNYGVVTTFGYQIASKKIRIEPSLFFYVGIKPEFTERIASSKFYRGGLKLSVGYSFKDPK
ncbi:MAG: hypothetical protein V4638_06615 [Bacteroidota bacterium]